MQIRRLLPVDAALFQALRLFALRETPHAFGASYEEEASLALSTIEMRLIGQEPCALMVDGELHDELHMCLC